MLDYLLEMPVGKYDHIDIDMTDEEIEAMLDKLSEQYLDLGRYS